MELFCCPLPRWSMTSWILRTTVWTPRAYRTALSVKSSVSVSEIKLLAINVTLSLKETSSLKEDDVLLVYYPIPNNKGNVYEVWSLSYDLCVILLTLLAQWFSIPWPYRWWFSSWIHQTCSRLRIFSASWFHSVYFFFFCLFSVFLPLLKVSFVKAGIKAASFSTESQV